MPPNTLGHRRLTPLLLLCAIATPLAQAAAPSLRSIQVQEAGAQRDKAALKMPFVHGGDAAATMRVNEYLFLHLLEQAPPQQHQPTWSPPSALDESLSELSHELHRLDAHVLSLSAMPTVCGAYCESSRESLNFDLQTGRRLALQDLLTPDGLRQLRERAHQVQRQTYAQLAKEHATHLALLSQGTSKPEKKKAMELAREQLDFTRDCEASARQTPPSLDTLSWQLQASHLRLLLAPCATHHAVRGLDEAGEVAVDLPFAGLSGAWTPYGQALLLGGPPAGAPPQHWLGQVIKGHIAGAPVTALLAASPVAPSSTVRGVYFYDKHRRPLLLQGKMSEGLLSLDERLSADEPVQARLVLQVQGPQLQGHWKGAKRTHPVLLK